MAVASAAVSLTRGVKDEILQWIREGRYPSGSQLPPVTDLTRKLNVSRTVVREALQSLVGMNLVEVRAGLGAYVRTVQPELVANADVVAALLDMDTLIEVARARRAIEGSVARLAASEATDEDFEKMEHALFTIRRAVARNQPMFSLTPAFHLAVASATHNRILEQVVSSFNSLMTAAGEVIERVHAGSTYRRKEYESHARLLKVLRTRDPDAAQKEMEKHVQQTVDMLEKIRKTRSVK